MVFVFKYLFTSGLVNKDKALEVLQAGNEYYQVTIKTAKAANYLKFIFYNCLIGEYFI